MNDPYPPPYPSSQPPPIVRRKKGLGCFATGCLIVLIVVMLAGVGIGSLSYVIYHGGEAYLSEKRTPARIVEASDEQYQAVLNKLAPFGQAMNEGRAATLEITPDELNVLIARSPQAEPLRGQLFLAATGERITADVSSPLNADARQAFFNGRATLDGSYASNGFAVALRHLEPLGGQSDTLFSRFINSPTMLAAFSQQISRSLNDGVRKQSASDPILADILRKLRTIIVHDGKFVVTLDAPPGSGSPTPAVKPTPVAAGDDQM